MTKTDTKKEVVGVIGQVYEDRRTHESGKLISRDEKCKTLTFESENGRTFVKTYSTFRSNFRKISDIITEDVKEEAYAEAELTSIELTEDEAAKAERKIARKEKQEAKAKEAEEKIISARSKRVEDGYAYVLSVVKEFVDSFNNIQVEYIAWDYKKCVRLKVRNKLLMAFYSRSKMREVYVVSVPQLFPSIQPTVDVFKCKHHSAKSANGMTETFSIKFDDLAQLLQDYKEAIIEILSYVKESED